MERLDIVPIGKHKFDSIQQNLKCLDELDHKFQKHSMLKVLNIEINQKLHIPIKRDIKYFNKSMLL